MSTQLQKIGPPSGGRLTPRPSSRTRGGLLVAAATGLLAACGGGGGDASQGGASSEMDLVAVSNGFGNLVPHQVYRIGPGGLPTPDIVPIRSVADLVDNVRANNPVLPITEWPAAAALPNGEPGNHYLSARFTKPIALGSVFDPAATGQSTSGLAGPITILAVDPTTGQTSPVAGRGFINGKTWALDANGLPQLQRWVKLDAAGKPEAVATIDNDLNGIPDGLGFPGTESASFAGGSLLVSPDSFVFVPDADGDLSSHETFPTGRQVRFRATAAVLSTGDEPLKRQVLGSATVGPDTLSPEVEVTPPPNSVPVVTPAFGDTNVDPSTRITISFTEPVQPLTVGALPTGGPPSLSTAVQLTFGPSSQLTQVPFTCVPASIYDFSLWELTPTFAFPGSGSASVQCGTFSTVSINLIPASISDLVQADPSAPISAGGNLNGLPANSFFVTGEGPGIVNAPVAPDVIYAARQGSTPSLSVIDLNGFGQSTGNPAFDFTYTSFPKGNSNFPNNPNFKIGGASLLPPLLPGTCTVDGGSAGVFTLTLDSALDDRLLRPPLITSIGDVMIGHSLDMVFNNAQDTSGCKAGAGNICALTGLKVVDGPNLISLAPHPNPPPLTYPPLCLQPFIGGAEPTSVASPGTNNLIPGNQPLGNPLAGVPPDGLLSSVGNTGFFGPDSPSKPLGACIPYQYRQQVGHFLYVIDRARREVVVLNSNRFTVLDRIQLLDPTDLAMSPNLDFMAVTNQKANSVSFIDIDPSSATFHKVVKTTPVGAGPRGVAWDPGNEGLIVCNEDDNSLSLISAFNFSVRKEVKNSLSQPFDVAISQRQVGFGWNRNVWFGWILNRNGTLAMYESGPSGINGWGYDDVIGTANFDFDSPQRLVVDIRDLRGAVWVAHQNPLLPDGSPSGQTGGALTSVVIDSSVSGTQYLNSTIAGNPQFRAMSIRILGSFGQNILTGVPTDISMDDMANSGNLINLKPSQGAGIPLATNGKAAVRGLVNQNGTTGNTGSAKAPEYLFVAIPNSTEGPGVVDVIKLSTGLSRFDTDPYLPGVQSIPIPGVRLLSDYWRQ